MKINDGQNGTKNFLIICQQRDKSLKTLHRAVLEEAAIVHATLTHVAMGEDPKWETIMQTQDSDLDSQATATTTTRLPAPQFKYNVEAILVQQAPMSGALPSYISVTLHACTLCCYYSSTIEGHSKE